ncbi:MAG TPA: nitroreductase family protein [Anaerovoracaceae bacterium]|nr:nitroreductase family protein [Anaerovoracaceae bacterium]
MDYKDAVNRRCSRRKYTAKEIDKTLVRKLMSSIEKYNEAAGLRIQLITNNGDAFDGFRKSYGMFSGVRNYLALVGKCRDKDRMEKEGYFGEKLVLEATAMGLSTCWVGSSYDKASCVCDIRNDETLDCAIVIGYTEEKHSLREKFMESVTHRKSKTVEQMVKCDMPMVPGWFTEGMKAVQRAPSARNLQPVLFSYQNGIVTAGVPGSAERSMIDLGIAKLHFEIGAGGGNWHWGSRAEYIR